MDQDHSLLKYMLDVIDVDGASKDVGKDVKVMKFDFMKKVTNDFLILSFQICLLALKY